MLLTARLFLVFRGDVFGMWSGFLWSLLLGLGVFSVFFIMIAMVIILIIILLLPIKHGKLRLLLILLYTMRNRRLFRLGIKLLLRPLQYFILYLHIFSALFSLFLFSLLLLFLFLHKLIDFYHVSLCDLAYFERFLRFTHVLYVLVLCS